MSNRTENVLADLATLFNNHADKVQAVPSVTALDLDSVRRIIKEELAKLPVQGADNTVKTVLEIKTPAGVKKLEQVQHEKFQEVLAVVNAGEPVYLYGPAGTGKSHIASTVAKVLGLDFYMANCITQEFKLTGFVDANGHYVETSFYKAFKNGGVFFLDELDGSTPEALININTALANKYFDFPGVGRVEAHENFRCIAAGNTLGSGADSQYTGRFSLDASSMDRFYFIHIDYSQDIEKAISGGDLKLVNFAHQWREACEKCGVQALFTYRAINRIATLKDVIPLVDVLQGSLLKGLDVDTLSNLFGCMTDKLRNDYIIALGEVVRKAQAVA